MTLTQKAILFAANAHEKQTRKGTDIPYIVHPMEVMKIVAGITDDENVRAAALLHDTVEDCGVSLEEIREKFGSRVAEIVGAESETKKTGDGKERPWRDRKNDTIHHLRNCKDEDILIVALGDKLANMRDIARDYEALGEDFWQRFNAKKEDLGWYYRSFCSALRGPLEDTAAWQELHCLVRNVFSTKSSGHGKFKYVCTFNDDTLIFQLKHHCYAFVNIRLNEVKAHDNWYYLTNHMELTQVGGHNENEANALEILSNSDIMKMIDEMPKHDGYAKEVFPNFDIWQNDIIRNFNKNNCHTNNI